MPLASALLIIQKLEMAALLQCKLFVQHILLCVDTQLYLWNTGSFSVV